jgi:hypothetical protein
MPVFVGAFGSTKLLSLASRAHLCNTEGTPLSFRHGAVLKSAVCHLIFRERSKCIWLSAAAGFRSIVWPHDSSCYCFVTCNIDRSFSIGTITEMVSETVFNDHRRLPLVRQRHTTPIAPSSCPLCLRLPSLRHMTDAHFPPSMTSSKRSATSRPSPCSSCSANSAPIVPYVIPSLTASMSSVLSSCASKIPT